MSSIGTCRPQPAYARCGRVLEIEGRTAGGQRYVSEFFVTAPQGTPQASVAVYWSGAGLGDSPLGEANEVLPQSECGNP
ncbi:MULTISPECIES: hypothetical protein [Streptomyces]|uniref:hypothetical protein n=1 Tax=Streptomyces TaxID=1883 RepID=UPI00133171E5|nr:hypothetical protein [Streptomyces alboflavus]